MSEAGSRRPSSRWKRDRITRVTFRGVHDGASWKNDDPIPGRTNDPLLFGRDRRPKPAFDTVLAVPRGARQRRPWRPRRLAD